MAQSFKKFNNFISEINEREDKYLSNKLNDYLSGYTTMNTEPKVFTTDDGFGSTIYYIISCDGKIKRKYTEHRGINDPSKTSKIIKDLIDEVRSQSPILQDLINISKDKIGINNSLPMVKDFFIPSPMENNNSSLSELDLDIMENKQEEVIKKPVVKNYIINDIQEISNNIESQKKSFFKKYFDIQK